MIRASWMILLVSTAIVSAEPPAPVTPEQEFIAEQLATMDLELRNGNPLPARPLSEIVRLKLVDGEFKFEILATDVGEVATIPLKDVKGVCQIQRFGNLMPSPNMVRISIHVVDVQRARSTDIGLNNIGKLQFDVVMSSPDLSITTQMSAPTRGPFGASDDEPMFHVQVVDEDGSRTTPSIRRTAESFAKLIDENHAQLLESTGEALRLLRSIHLLSSLSEAEARQMLATNKPAGADVEQRISAAIEKVKADPDAGEAQLEAVLKASGPAAASVLARAPREGWSADVTMRIDNVLAPFLLQNSDAAAKVNAQPERLVDLFYWPDQEIRAGAFERLKALTSAKIDFDPAGDPYSQFDRIEALRAELASKP
jgi:hypothetical protein